MLFYDECEDVDSGFRIDDDCVLCAVLYCRMHSGLSVCAENIPAESIRRIGGLCLSQWMAVLLFRPVFIPGRYLNSR